MISDADMPGNTDLTAESAMLADFGTAGDTDLGGQNRIRSDRDVMGDMDQVVEFGPASDQSRSKRGPIDTGTGPNLDVVFNNDIAYLGNFHVALTIRGKSG
jgi:hypothetical protein